MHSPPQPQQDSNTTHVNIDTLSQVEEVLDILSKINPSSNCEEQLNNNTSQFTATLQTIKQSLHSYIKEHVRGPYCPHEFRSSYGQRKDLTIVNMQVEVALQSVRECLSFIEESDLRKEDEDMAPYS